MNWFIPFKADWIKAAVIIVLLSCPMPVFAESDNGSDIWTEDTNPPMGDIRSDRRIDAFLDRIEQDNPQRAEELRKLRKEDPDKFQQALREEMQKYRPADRPRSQDSMAGPRGPMGPGGPRQEGPNAMQGPEGPGGDAPRNRWLEHLQRRHDEFIEWLQKNNPELATELAQLKDKDQNEYFARVMDARRQYDPILRAERDNPELASVLKEDMALQKQREELLREIRGAEGEKRDQLFKDLEALVSQRFDLIIRKKTLQYQELEERLKRLQVELEKRQTEVQKLQVGKNQAVKQRVKDLTAQIETIDWN